MDYVEAVDHLYALGPELPVSGADSPPRRKFDLAHMRTLCAALGNPERQVPAILIAGTNGKGSTAATLASILTAGGYRTGLYTSPHLVRVNERIQIAHPTLPSEYGAATVHGADGQLALAPISDDDFARIYSRVDDACEALVSSAALVQIPSFFERLTAVAFCFYAEAKAEVMVLEVGLGGRLDATNVVAPLLSVITDIALDHQEYLGTTIAEIAREKCGILREHGTLITLPQLQEANLAIGQEAVRLECRAINAAQYLPPAQRNGPPDHEVIPNAVHPPNHDVMLDEVQNRSSGLARAGNPSPVSHLQRNVYTLTLEDRSTLHVDSPLAGAHQQRNLALAIAAALELCNRHGYKISNAALQQGIRDTRWPGRLEFLAPDLLLDVAHNPAGAWTLRAALAALPESQPRTLIFSCLRDKSLTEMSRILFPLFDSSADGDPLRRHDHIVLAPIANPRAAAVEDLIAAAHALGVPAHAAPHLAGALAQARSVTPPNGIIVATGSVYLVGEIRALALDGRA